MKILLATHAFHPDIGGLETVSRILAEQFVARGHEVRVVTRTLARAPAPGVAEETFAFPVLRRPPPGELLRLVRWCDVYLQNNISLQTLWPLLLVRRPWVVVHQGWLTRTSGAVGWQDRIKMFVLRFGRSIAISRASAEPLPVPAKIVGNPYQDHIFRLLPGMERDRDLVFLARLVTDKGGDMVIDSLAALKKDGLMPSLTVVGDGPELANLRQQAARLGVADQVVFTGILTGEALVKMLNRHRIMLVPSRLPEPFGVVALEGIACGCVVLGSDRGGLPDAIGPCGLTFPNDDLAAMTAYLQKMLRDDALLASLRGGADEQLRKHSQRQVAEEYLRVFEEVRR